MPERWRRPSRTLGRWTQHRMSVRGRTQAARKPMRRTRMWGRMRGGRKLQHQILVKQRGPPQVQHPERHRRTQGQGTRRQELHQMQGLRQMRAPMHRKPGLTKRRTRAQPPQKRAEEHRKRVVHSERQRQGR